MNDPKERIKKLYALAMRGVGGEKKQAQALLEKLLKKYDLTLEELDEEKINRYELEYHGKEQEELLVQTIYKVTGSYDEIYSLRFNKSGRACKTRLAAYCTEAQKAEIDFLFDFYCRLWEKERARLLSAFIQKHEIFGALKEGEKCEEISHEERMKLYALMRGLSDEQPLKQLTNGKE